MPFLRVAVPILYGGPTLSQGVLQYKKMGGVYCWVSLASRLRGQEGPAIQIIGGVLPTNWRCFSSKPKGPGEKGAPRNRPEISSQVLVDFECRFPYDSYMERTENHFGPF